MGAKEYLKQIKELDIDIKQRQIECDSLREIVRSARNIKYDERVQTSRQGYSLEEMILKYVQIEKEIDDMIDRFVNLKHKIITEIQGLTEVKHIDVLFKRYVQYTPFDQIAIEMNYTYQYVYELHRNALREFEKTYKIL